VFHVFQFGAAGALFEEAKPTSSPVATGLAECQKLSAKALCFDESKCKFIDEVDQDTSTSSNSQFKQSGLKGSLAS